jgi:hypothetical protein
MYGIVQCSLVCSGTTPVLLILKVRTYVLQLMKVVGILTMVVILYTHLQLGTC